MMSVHECVRARVRACVHACVCCVPVFMQSQSHKIPPTNDVMLIVILRRAVGLYVGTY